MMISKSPPPPRLIIPKHTLRPPHAASPSSGVSTPRSGPLIARNLKLDHERAGARLSARLVVGRRPNNLISPSTTFGGSHTAGAVTSHRAAHAVGHQRLSHRGGSDRIAADLKETVAMAPTKDAQKLRRAAERKGKAEDQYQLGVLYHHGREGLEQDWVAAVKWRSKAAAQEHAGAQLSLGDCYYKGEGVDKSQALAATWISTAADQGHANAQGYLGVLYHYGKGVEQDDAMAVAWWKKGAVGGDAVSQFNLGRGYMHGEAGLPKNAHCAKIYMMAAADQDYSGQAEAIEALKKLRACAACGAPDASRACQGCRTATGLCTARYCTPACQAAHWKAHEPHCGPCQCHRCK